MGRLFAISDIHGCLKQFKALIDMIGLKPKDTLVLMGDYIDRGEDSKGVLDYIIELDSKFNIIPLLGNHDAMMRDVFLATSEKKKDWAASIWIQNGGIKTLESYGLSIEDIYTPYQDLPEDLVKHLHLISAMPLYHITDTHIFVHSTPRQDEAIEAQNEMELMWRRPSVEDRQGDYLHISGKTVISGHTAQNGKPLMLSDHNILIDTGCFFTGVLTAIEICDKMHPTQEFIFHKVDGADL